MSDSVDTDMDPTPRRSRNSKEDPPNMSGDSDREMIEEFSKDFKRIEEFVWLFEEEKQEIEGHLGELSGIADGLDEAHRKAAIAKTTGSSVSAAGGIMTITGLVLAPFTFGASIALSVAGVGAAVAGGVTNVTTEIVKASSDRDDNKRVEEILAIIQSKMSALGESVNNACLTLSKWDEYHIEKVILKSGGQLGSAYSAVGNIASMVKTFKILTANPVLKALAKQVAVVSSRAAMAAGRSAAKAAGSSAAKAASSSAAKAASSSAAKAASSSAAKAASSSAAKAASSSAAKAASSSAAKAASSSAAKAASSSTAKAASSSAAKAAFSAGARIAGGVVAGAFVAWDVYDIRMNLIDIDNGCKTERAKEIRELVENVKGDLKNLEGVYSNMKGCM